MSSRVNPRRRALLQSMLAGLIVPSSPAGANEAQTTLRFGTTPVILDEQAEFLARWRLYLETLLRRPIHFVQRGSYREILVLLVQGRLDCAWLCGYPYVRMRQHLDLVAVPLYAGRPLYRAYLIVPSNDRTTRSIRDMRGKVFAFSDPDSNPAGWCPRSN